MNCKYCKEILGIKFKKHGYGLSEYQAEMIIKMKILDKFEATTHYLIKLGVVNPK